MRDKIINLQKRTRVLEPTSSERKLLNQHVLGYAEAFLNNIDESLTYEPKEPTYGFKSDYKDGSKIEDILEIMERDIDHCGINPAGPGHLGYIPGGGIYASSLGDYLADITNRYSGLKFASPGAVALENELIDWSKNVIGFPNSALGNITSGGSIANLIAIVAARDFYELSGSLIEDSVIYLTNQTHHCVQKALRIAGLGKSKIRYVDLDKTYRMSIPHLNESILRDKNNGLRPFLVVASCGSTDTGAIDPLSDIATIAKKYGIWFHIDAAYGGYFILCDQLKDKLTGIERADSIVMDPHKTLFLPYGSGIVLVREGRQLFNSFHYTANYLQDADINEQNISPADLSPELTKHFRGLRMWLPLKLYGTSPFRDMLYEKHLLTRYFYAEVQKLGFEVGPEPELSVCIYRYDKISESNDFNAKLVKMIQKDGRIFVSSTTIDGVFWIRAAIVCFRTHLKHIDLYLELLKQLTKELKSA